MTTQIKPNPDMLMNKYATPEVMEQLEGVVTPHGWTAQKAIQSGIDNPDSSIGVYVGDSESIHHACTFSRSGNSRIS